MHLMPLLVSAVMSVPAPPAQTAGALVFLVGKALSLTAGAAAAPELGSLASAVSAPLMVVPGSGALAVKTLPEVIDGATQWVMTIIAALATLFLVIGGLRYITAAGDPAAVEQAKGSFRAALMGYALAVLAGPVLKILQGILGA